MPYPRAHYFLLAIVPLIALAFWPGYFSRLGETPLAVHVHGVTASSWILLLMLQSWAIHSRRFALHRLAGRSSFFVFPLFLVGGLMVLHSMARTIASGANPFMDAFGPGLGALDALSVIAFAGLYFAALRNRGQVQVHARYLLATPLLLLAPIFTRLFVDHVPGLAINGPEDMGRFVYGLHLANVIALAMAVTLYASAPAHGRAFLVAGVVIMLHSIAFQWLGVAPWWREFYASLGSLPTAVPVALGLAAGTAIVYLGWGAARPTAGRRAVPDPVV